METNEDGFDCELSDKTKMSTAALIAFIYGSYSQSMSKELYYEVLECVQELYGRHVVKPKIDRNLKQ
jgi:hypothetical protein